MGKGVNIIITDDKNRVLVLKRIPKSKLSPSLWNLPGGKVNRGENLNQAVIREVKEETNLELKSLGKPFYIYYYPKTTVYAIKTRVIKGKIFLNKEHSKFRWVSNDDWENLKYTPSGLATLKKFLNNQPKGVASRPYGASRALKVKS